MISFSNWFLSPYFKMELKSKDSFLPHEAKDVSLHIIVENDFNSNSLDTTFAKNLYGELTANHIYPLNELGKNCFYFAPMNSVRKLSHQVAGKSHSVSSMGSEFSVCLIRYIKESKHFHLSKNIFISLSDEVKKIISPEEFEFLLGILQKSVSNKIKRSFHKNGENKNLIFCEDTFSRSSFQKALCISNAMCTTRSLINMPANELNPESYEAILKSVVTEGLCQTLLPNQIQMETFSYEKLQQKGCNLICAVGQGSQHKPRILKLTYTPKVSSNNLKHVTLVGKGITFDSGGYDIKASSGMRIMKKDMGGSAAAIGIFFSCVSLQLPVKISCYLAIAENMIGGNAMRPGDIYQSLNGLHVEIENTDAEGRLVLADTLCLACEEKPDWLIDFATLTGAARVSLGTMVDSLFGNSKETTDLLFATGIENGDWVWPMPLPADYESYLESSVTDMMNSSASSFAGSITAALFLQKFVSVEKWNHIDTYMWCDKAHYLWQEGSSPTGKCVRLVTRAIELFLSKEDTNINVN